MVQLELCCKHFDLKSMGLAWQDNFGNHHLDCVKMIKETMLASCSKRRTHPDKSVTSGMQVSIRPAIPEDVESIYNFICNLEEVSFDFELFNQYYCQNLSGTE